jgi:hypothetical protein
MSTKRRPTAIATGRNRLETIDGFRAAVTRRGVIGVGLGAIAAPYVIGQARAADTVKIGFVDPFTGTYAAFAANEQIGAQMAVDALNAKNGILGRKVEMISEDTQSNVGVGVQKANKLLDRDNWLPTSARRSRRCARRRRSCSWSPAAMSTT